MLCLYLISLHLFSDTNATCAIMSFVNSIPYFIIFFDEVFAIIKKGEIVGQLALLMCSNITLILMITNISLCLMSLIVNLGLYRSYECLQDFRSRWNANRNKATQPNKQKSNIMQRYRDISDGSVPQFGRNTLLVHVKPKYQIHQSIGVQVSFGRKESDSDGHAKLFGLV